MAENKKENLEKRVNQHIYRIYEGILNSDELTQLTDSILSKIIDSQHELPKHITQEGEPWSEKTIVLITYADTINDKNNLPINTINNFLHDHAKDFFEIVHILPSIAWILHQSPHIIPIPGTRSVTHFKQHCAGARLTLSDADIGHIEELLPVGWAHGDRYSTAQWVGPEKYC